MRLRKKLQKFITGWIVRKLFAGLTTEVNGNDLFGTG